MDRDGPDCLLQARGNIARRAWRSAQINRPGPSGPRQTGTSQSVCSPCWPDWRGGLPNCLPPGGPAADQHLYFLFLEFNKNSPWHFARFLASTSYSSELFLVSCSLFHFLISLSIQLEYQQCIRLECPLWQYCNFNLISLGIPALPISGSID
jgi:hypothetical protein